MEKLEFEVYMVFSMHNIIFVSLRRTVFLNANTCAKQLHLHARSSMIASSQQHLNLNEQQAKSRCMDMEEVVVMTDDQKIVILKLDVDDQACSST